MAIARAIVNRPQIILADEPTANLDRASANQVLDALKSFHAVGVTCLISTHDEQFLDSANRVVFLDHGQVTETWRRQEPAARQARMKGWLRQHRFALAVACAHLLKSPASFALNVLVVAIAFALPIAGLTLLDNIRPVSAQLAVEPEISIFLGMDTSREQAKALAPAIRRVLPQQAQGAAKLEFVPREQALDALKDKSGLSDALATLGSNPLPDGYVLKLPRFSGCRRRRRHRCAGDPLAGAAGSGSGAGRFRLGQAAGGAAAHPAPVLAAAGGDAGGGGDRGDLQHDPAAGDDAARGNRGIAAGRRHRCLHPPAVLLQRRAAWPVRRRRRQWAPWRWRCNR